MSRATSGRKLASCMYRDPMNSLQDRKVAGPTASPQVSGIFNARKLKNPPKLVAIWWATPTTLPRSHGVLMNLCRWGDPFCECETRPRFAVKNTDVHGLLHLQPLMAVFIPLVPIKSNINGDSSDHPSTTPSFSWSESHGSSRWGSQSRRSPRCPSATEVLGASKQTAVGDSSNWLQCSNDSNVFYVCTYIYIYTLCIVYVGVYTYIYIYDICDIQYVMCMCVWVKSSCPWLQVLAARPEFCPDTLSPNVGLQPLDQGLTRLDATVPGQVPHIRLICLAEFKKLWLPSSEPDHAHWPEADVKVK